MMQKEGVRWVDFLGFFRHDMKSFDRRNLLTQRKKERKKQEKRKRFKRER